jgi:hypothetical protein
MDWRWPMAISVSTIWQLTRCVRLVVSSSVEPDSNIDGAVWISRWQQSAGRTDDAIQTLEEDLSECSNNFPSIAEYLSLLSKVGHCNGVISALKKLGEALSDFPYI